MRVGWGGQCTSKQQLWGGAVLTSRKEIAAETLQKLTSPMDVRIVKLLSGSYGETELDRFLLGSYYHLHQGQKLSCPNLG